LGTTLGQQKWSFELFQRKIVVAEHKIYPLFDVDILREACKSLGKPLGIGKITGY